MTLCFKRCEEQRCWSGAAATGHAALGNWKLEGKLSCPAFSCQPVAGMLRRLGTLRIFPATEQVQMISQLEKVTCCTR
jgi:hypothetical protein